MIPGKKPALPSIPHFLQKPEATNGDLKVCLGYFIPAKDSKILALMIMVLAMSIEVEDGDGWKSEKEMAKTRWDLSLGWSPTWVCSLEERKASADQRWVLHRFLLGGSGPMAATRVNEWNNVGQIHLEESLNLLSLKKKIITLASRMLGGTWKSTKEREPLGWKCRGWRISLAHEEGTSTGSRPVTLKRPTVLTQDPEFQFLSVASCGLPGNSKQGGWFHYNSQGGAPPLTPSLLPASEWDNMILPPGGDGRPPSKGSGRWEVSPQGQAAWVPPSATGDWHASLSW